MKFEINPELTELEKIHFKEKLVVQLRSLMHETDDTVHEMQENVHEFPDPGDRATYEFERNTTLRIRDRERKLLKKVQNSLKRLEENEYNVCQDCGNAIGKERLNARPVTTQCIDCKESQEQEERNRRV